MQNTKGQKYSSRVRHRSSKSTSIGGIVTTGRKGLFDQGTLLQTVQTRTATVTVNTVGTARKNVRWGLETEKTPKDKGTTSKRFAVALKSADIVVPLNIVRRIACNTFALRWTFDRLNTTNVRGAMVGCRQQTVDSSRDVAKWWRRTFTKKWCPQ